MTSETSEPETDVAPVSSRARWIGLAVVLVLVTALSSIFVVRGLHDEAVKNAPTAATVKDQALDLGSVLDAPHVVFLSAAPGPTDGKLAAVPLADPDGNRSVSGLSCDRVYATAEAGVCESTAKAGLTYQISYLDSRMRVVRTAGLTGVPSRARISPDSSLVGTTVFVSGHSYATMGFSTETHIVDRATGQDYGNLETAFAMNIDPRRNHAPDLNIWGTTFAPGANPNTFYATVSAGGETWLARGDLKAKTLTAIHTDAECPTLSPDGKIVVYKKRAGSAIRWRFHALDLRTGKEWALPETRNVDDQAEWLDNSHVLYAIPKNGGRGSDVWVTDIRTGKPSLYLPDASSPAVVR